LKWKTSSEFDRLLWQEWEGEFFLYDPRSGQTHILNGASALILGLLREECMDLNQIQRSMLQMLDPGESQWSREHLRFHLAHLEDLLLLVPEGPQAS